MDTSKRVTIALLASSTLGLLAMGARHILQENAEHTPEAKQLELGMSVQPSRDVKLSVFVHGGGNLQLLWKAASGPLQHLFEVEKSRDGREKIEAGHGCQGQREFRALQGSLYVFKWRNLEQRAVNLTIQLYGQFEYATPQAR